MQLSKFEQLLAKARALAPEAAAKAEADKISESNKRNGVTNVEMANVGLPDSVVSTDAGEDAAVDFIKETISAAVASPSPSPSPSSTTPVAEFRGPGVARQVTLNPLQQEFFNDVIEGKDCILIGAAGTGKTTATGKTTVGLIESGRIGNIQSPTKWLQVGKPGIAILSYTRKAVNNIRYAVDVRLKSHTLTIHKLLEFAPVTYEMEDKDNPGTFKKTMRFEPQRNAGNPLPTELKLLVFEESSMVSVELYHMLAEAMPHKHQEVFLGDIQQLPPVFGMAILGFKMLELPVIELKEVYRQALESPIIDLAWKVLRGDRSVFAPKYETFQQVSPHTGKTVSRIRVPALDKLSRTNTTGSVLFQVWQKKQSPDLGCDAFVKQVTAWIGQGYFNAEDDIILCPFNKAFGTIELNKGISQFLGTQRKAMVHEIIAGYNRHYLAVGDRVLYDKEDAVVVDIGKSSDYTGERPQPASVNLDRWGHQQDALSEEEVTKELTEDMSFDADAFLENTLSNIEERVNKASHTVVVKLKNSEEGETIELSDARQINDLLGGYAITVHKAQGSEYERVFLVMHHTHAIMNQRELLYTAITRAKKFLHIVCEYDTFWDGVYGQRIKGNTIQQKAEFFTGKKGVYDEAKKEMEEKRDAANEFRPESVSVPDTATAISIRERAEEARPRPVISLSDLIPANIKELIGANLDKYWKKAQAIWGDDAIGAEPILSYNINSDRVLGKALCGRNIIKLNPIWCAMGAEDQEVLREMSEITLIHEICHLVSWNYAKDRGHGPGWKMAMKLMGLPPDRMYEGDELPPWMASKDELMRKHLESYKQEADDLGMVFPKIDEDSDTYDEGEIK